MLAFGLFVYLICFILYTLDYDQKFLITNRRFICIDENCFDYASSVYFNTIDGIRIFSDVIEQTFDLHSLEIMTKDLKTHFIPGIENAQKVAEVLKKAIERSKQRDVV